MLKQATESVNKSETVQKMVKATNEGIEATREKAGPAWENTKEKMSEGAASVKEMSSNAVEKTKEAMSSASDTMAPSFRRVSLMCNF